MDIDVITPRQPDVRILLTHDEADNLLNMVIEGKAYAADCGESTEHHELFIEMLSEALR